MSLPEELLSHQDTITATEYYEWRDNQLETVAQTIGEVESIIPIAAPFHILCEAFTLDPRNSILAGSLSTDEYVVRAELLNVMSTYGHKRKGGNPYASHSVIVGNSIVRFASGMPTEGLIERKKLASLHDVVEEGPHRYVPNGIPAPNTMLDFPLLRSKLDITAAARTRIDNLFPGQGLGRGVVELMEPIIPESVIEMYLEMGADRYLVEYSHFTRMLQRSESDAVRDVEVADRIDDITDRGYILNNELLTEDEKARKLINKFARCFHTVSAISDNSNPALVNLFNSVYKEVLQASSHLLSSNEVDQRVDEFDTFLGTQTEQIDVVLNEYLDYVTT